MPWVNKISIGNQLRAFYVLIVLCLAIGTYAVHSANEKSLKNCRRTELLKTYAVSLAQRSNASIDNGTSPIVGEKEQAIARANNQFIIDTFRPQPCDPGLFGLF